VQQSEETEANQGAIGAAGGPLQGAQHPQPEAKGCFGKATEPQAKASGGVVPKQKSQNEVEADRGGL